MQIILQILLILAMAAIPGPSPVLAAQNTYNGSGTGPTERAAIQDAFRKILENAQGIEVESNSYLTNSTIDRDRIHSYTNGHIENYTLLDSHFDGAAYTVKIEADVSPGTGLAAPQAARSTEHLGISDLIIGLDVDIGKKRFIGLGAKDNQTIKTGITNSLAEAGFDHIFPIDGMEKGTYDYLIKGSLTSMDMPMNLSTKIPLYSNQATLNIEVIRCGTGENLLTGEYLGSSIDISKQNAETAAGNMAGSKAAAAIVTVLRSAAVNVQKNYTITVKNASNFRQIMALKDYLSNACNAGNVVVKTFEENNAVLTLNFTGGNDDLAELLTQNPGYSAVITKITASTIELTY